MDWRRGTEGHLGAEVIYPGLAVAAGPAGHTRLNGHPVSLPDIGHPLSHLSDHTCSLVTQHHGGLDNEVTNGAVSPVMDI